MKSFNQAYNTSAIVFGFHSGYSETFSWSTDPTSPPPRPHSSCRNDGTSEEFFAIAASSSDSGRYVTFSFFPVLSSCCLKIWLKDWKIGNQSLKKFPRAVPHLAVAFDAEDPPLQLQSWQVGEHVCNVSTYIRLYRERVECITV